ncbi:MAG: FHA domain-containing protein [Lachnospiraceae bacterium]|nr:FHA domain-containing protein [Lachnospiraceae bacterium]
MSVLYVFGEWSSFIVGRDPKADLVLEDSFVSRNHLRLSCVTADVAAIEVLGGNGAVIRGIKAGSGYRGYIRAGDCIMIGNRAIVWLGGDSGHKPIICPVQRRPLSVPDPVEIENPPPRKIPEKPSVMLAAGPALTMAVPILLGAGRTIAVLSSVFAAVWAVANVTNRIRKGRSEEKRRRNTYLAYLEECEETIIKRSEDAAKALYEMYPCVGKYLSGGANALLLWSVKDDRDCPLTIRAGRGLIKSPVDIQIPKERFAGVDDSLKDLPGMLKKKYESLKNAPVLVNIAAGAVMGFNLFDERNCRVLAAVIMQAAVSYSPDELKIMMDLRRDIGFYYMWVLWLPHYVRPDELEEGVRCILITDDAAKAFGSASSGTSAFLVGRSFDTFPAGVEIVNKERDRSSVRFDTLARELCFSYAGQLSQLWGCRRDDDRIAALVSFKALIDDIPSYSDPDRLIELLTEKITGNYKTSDITGRIAAPIGLGAGDRKVFLDLHEKAMGPHGLIAGTTGSGKSELLTTLILSFAMNYPADKLGFFLVDYKGGGMSNLFEGLPHLMGNISNLTKAESGRAMTALKSENIRRQKIFNEYGVNNINDYTHLYDKGIAPAPLPHVLIIVDEFAELRKEEPEFMDRLISISQVGRSLGMHLILATQKPAGVVDDKIRGNSRFRIALRLVDRSDSVDMLQRPDAAAIRECGRACLQVGNDEIFECFQSAYAMGSISSSAAKPGIYEDFFLDKEIFTDDDERVKPAREDERTWYEVIFNAIREADEKMDVKKPQKLWLPPLPDTISDDRATVVFDNPYMQRYERFIYEPKVCGHILITGRSASGKSELLHTIISRTGGRTAVYVIDLGGGRLREFSSYKCCGGYIGDEGGADIERMTGFLTEELTRRRVLLQKNEDATEPAVLLVLDNLTEIRKGASAEANEYITRILTFGRSTGIYVAATALTCGIREEKFFDMQLILGNEDIYAVASSLRVPARDIPQIKDIPGRGVGVADGVSLEFQAVVTNERILPPKDEIEAEKYPFVPKDPSLEDFLKRAVCSVPPPSVPVGYEIKSGKIYTLPIDRINIFLICGKPFSGRHTLLFNISITAARYGIKCIRADSYEALISVCRSARELTIVTVEDLAGTIESFYEGQFSRREEDELISVLENPPLPKSSSQTGAVVAAIMENDARTRLSGRRVFDAVIRHPYGLSLGGCLDENRILDYSYLPYSIMQKSQSRGIATVIRFDEKTFSGDIKVPLRMNVYNSQNVENRGLVTHDINRIDLSGEGEKTLYESG